MKKFLYDIRMLFKHENFTFFALLLITFASQFFTTYLIGTYQYCIYHRNLLKDYFFENAAYCVTFNIENMDRMNEIKEQLEVLDGVETVLCQEFFYLQGGERLSVINYTEDMWKYMPVVNSDSFYAESNYDSDMPECILFGDVFEDSDIEDIIEIPFANENVNAKVVNVVRDDSYWFDYSRSSTAMSAFDLFNKQNIVFVKECSKTDTQFKKTDGINFMLFYKDDISSQQKNAITDLLQSYSYNAIEYSELSANTENKVVQMIKDRLPTPIFFAIIGRFSCFVVTIVFISKKLKELTIKRLVGSSHNRSVVTCMLAVNIPSLISFVVNTFFWSLYPMFYEKEIFMIGYFRLTNNLYVILAVDLLLTAVITGLAIRMAYVGKTLIELIRYSDNK